MAALADTLPAVTELPDVRAFAVPSTTGDRLYMVVFSDDGDRHRALSCSCPAPDAAVCKHMRLVRGLLDLEAAARDN